MTIVHNYTTAIALMGLLLITACDEDRDWEDGAMDGCGCFGISVYVLSPDELDAVTEFLDFSNYDCSVETTEENTVIDCNEHDYGPEEKHACDKDAQNLLSQLKEQGFTLEVTCGCTCDG